jgi:hypothetical protein
MGTFGMSRTKTLARAKGTAARQFYDYADEQVDTTFSPFNSTLVFLSTAGATWEASTTTCYNCEVNFINIPHSTDKVGCYNHHTADQWVNCKHYDCTYPVSCVGPGAPPPPPTPVVANKKSASQTGARELGSAVPFVSAAIDERVRSQVIWSAMRQDVNSAGLVEVGAVGIGEHIYGAVVGSHAGGGTRVAFLGGVSHSGFTRVEGKLISPSTPLYAQTAATRTTTGDVEAGVVGIVSAAVTRVTVGRADGTTTAARLIAWGSSPYASFSMAGEGADAPRFVRAYGENGLLVAEKLPSYAIQVPRS